MANDLYAPKEATTPEEVLTCLATALGALRRLSFQYGQPTWLNPVYKIADFNQDITTVCGKLMRWQQALALRMPKTLETHADAERAADLKGA